MERMDDNFQIRQAELAAANSPLGTREHGLRLRAMWQQADFPAGAFLSRRHRQSARIKTGMIFT
jgi:hypothetical protein